MGETIFVVEDDADICRLLQYHLTVAGFEVRLFTRAGPAFMEATVDPPALFLLDIMLPGGDDGLSLCRRIRSDARFANARVIFVSAKSAEADRVIGLEVGADEYITKPFSPRELVARVRAVLRRGLPIAPLPTVRVGELEIDSSAMIVRSRGEPVSTTTTEFRILEALAGSRGRVVSRNRLLKLVWGDTEVDPHSIDVYVSRLRSKIEPDPDHPVYLRTVRGVGYRFDGSSVP